MVTVFCLIDIKKLRKISSRKVADDKNGIICQERLAQKK